MSGLGPGGGSGRQARAPAKAKEVEGERRERREQGNSGKGGNKSREDLGGDEKHPAGIVVLVRDQAQRARARGARAARVFVLRFCMRLLSDSCNLCWESATREPCLRPTALSRTKQVGRRRQITLYQNDAATPLCGVSQVASTTGIARDGRSALHRAIICYAKLSRAGVCWRKQLTVVTG